MLLTLLIPIIFFSIRDIRRAKQEGSWAYLLIYLAMMTTAAVLWLLLWRNVSLTSPNQYIIKMLQSWFGVP